MIHFHDYQRSSLIRRYIDSSGFTVEVWTVKCSKCGKTKRKKFWHDKYELNIGCVTYDKPEPPEVE